MKTWQVDSDYSVVLDDNDFEALAKLGKWHIHFRGGASPGPYLRGRKSIMAHHVIAYLMGLNVDYPIKFVNSNSLDLRRANLEENRLSIEHAGRGNEIGNFIVNPDKTKKANKIAERRFKAGFEVCDRSGKPVAFYEYADKVNADAHAAKIRSGFVRPTKILLSI